MKKTNKKTKKIMTKCPHCGLDLVKDAGIGYSQAGEMLYDVSFNGHDLEYEQDEFGDADGGEFFCRSCGKTLPLTEEDIIKILK